MKRLALLGIMLIAVSVLAGGAITGCGSKKGALETNMLPGVELTATPPAGDTTRYDIEFHWTGWDFDGEVDHFEFYIDPPLEVIQNPRGFTDTLTWRETDAYSGRFTFYAPDYDSSTVDEPHRDYKSPQIGLGYHVFVIRAVDDMGAASVVNDSSWVAFTAATICPKSKITSPPPEAAEDQDGRQQAAQTVGLRVTFRWDGTDSDGIFADKPIYYMYKLTELPAQGITWDQIAGFVLADPAPWDTLDTGVTQVTLLLDDGRNYGFAVRAVDEARSVEPLLVLNRNLLWVGGRQSSSSPKLEIWSSSFGNRAWYGWFIDIEQYEVPLGSLFEFTLKANADWYGGLITGFSYGWNLPDVENNDTNPTGDRAWTPWSTSQTKVVAHFTEDFTRNPETGEVEDVFLYVRCKDDGGAVTLATIQFNVVTLDPIYRLGYIDDWRLYPKPGGEIHDDMFWQQMLEGYDYGKGWDALVWDEWDAPYGEETPTLKFLSQFETLAWSLNDKRELGPPDKSAFFVMNFVNNVNVLAVYLSSETREGNKAKVWLYGNGMTESTILSNGGAACDYPYPVNEDAGVQSCAIRPQAFSYDFMHLVGQYDKSEEQPSGARVNKFVDTGDRVSYIYLDETGPAIDDTLYTYDPAVNPMPYRNLPRTLNTDLSRYRVISMRQFEVLDSPRPEAPVQPLFWEPGFGDIPGKPTGLVPLYKFRATDPKSRADGLYCAFRYVPSRGEHGEIVYFWFPMYILDASQARQTAKAVLTDMFGLPDPDTWEPPSRSFRP